MTDVSFRVQIPSSWMFGWWHRNDESLARLDEETEIGLLKGPGDATRLQGTLLRR